MVLEHLFPEEWIEKKSYYAFLLGAGYSVIGIILSRLLFAADPALPAVAFTSLLLLPELYKMFSIEEKQQRFEKKTWGFKQFWKDNGDFYRVFIFLFLGILLVYSLGAMFLPALSVNKLFREQVALRGPGFSAAGNATYNTVGEASAMGGLFMQLLQNNFWILFACFVVALLAGDGAIFLITWNASVWGAIFGLTARNAAFFSNSQPMWFFAIIFLTVTPHMLLEASSYILAAMSGGLISKAAVVQGWGGKRFQKVFKENMYILGLALVALVLGAFVEAFVLLHSAKYAQIIQMSFLAN